MSDQHSSSASTGQADELRSESPAGDRLATADCGSGADAAPAGHGYTPEKKRYLARLKRIEGQVRGLHRMVEEDSYCIDVLTQISAVNSALENVALGLLEDHLAHCVRRAAAAGDPEASEKIQEASAAIARLVKS